MVQNWNSVISICQYQDSLERKTPTKCKIISRLDKWLGDIRKRNRKKNAIHTPNLWVSQTKSLTIFTFPKYLLIYQHNPVISQEHMPIFCYKKFKIYKQKYFNAWLQTIFKWPGFASFWIAAVTVHCGSQARRTWARWLCNLVWKTAVTFFLCFCSQTKTYLNSFNVSGDFLQPIIFHNYKKPTERGW